MQPAHSLLLNNLKANTDPRVSPGPAKEVMGEQTDKQVMVKMMMKMMIMIMMMIIMMIMMIVIMALFIDLP